MKRLALIASITMVACGDDSGSTDSLGSNSADDSISAGTGATDTGGETADDGGSSAASASVSGSTSNDGSTGGADSAGSSGAATGSESAGDDTFACGDALMCSVATQYCQETIGGPKGSPPHYMCMDLPEGCQPEPSCDCLGDVGCNMCQMSGAGLQVTCFAP